MRVERGASKSRHFRILCQLLARIIRLLIYAKLRKLMLFQ